MLPYSVLYSFFSWPSRTSRTMISSSLLRDPKDSPELGHCVRMASEKYCHLPIGKTELGVLTDSSFHFLVFEEQLAAVGQTVHASRQLTVQAHLNLFLLGHTHQSFL